LTRACSELAGRLVLFAWLAVSAGLIGCAPLSEKIALTPPEVVDRLTFIAQDEDLKPIAGAQIEALIEAGQCLGPNPALTGPDGRVVMTFKPLARSLNGGGGRDVMWGYQTVVRYRVTAEGCLPVWGQADFFDAWRSFARPPFAGLMARRPADKTRTVSLTLIRTVDLFEAEAQADPLSRLVRAGLPELWRQWSLSGRAYNLRPARASWGVDRRGGGAYLRAGMELGGLVGGKSDVAIYQVFSDWYLPLVADLAAVYSGLFAGWDLTLVMNLQGDDPHAIPLSRRLRIVFSEETRRRLLAGPGGLNRLLVSAQTRSLNGRPWDPVERMEANEARQDYLAETLSLFFAPGPPL